MNGEFVPKLYNKLTRQIIHPNLRNVGIAEIGTQYVFVSFVGNCANLHQENGLKRQDKN